MGGWESPAVREFPPKKKQKLNSGLGSLEYFGPRWFVFQEIPFGAFGGFTYILVGIFLCRKFGVDVQVFRKLNHHVVIIYFLRGCITM